MMKRKFIGIALVLVLVLTACALVACNPGNPDATEGELYRTSVVKFNSVVSAYVSFVDYGANENEWGESGKVYEIKVSQSGGNFAMWSDGYWSLENNTLTLTPKNQDSNTCIVDTNKDEAKTFTATDGTFSFEVKVSGCGTKGFTFNPTTDKVGEDTSAPCTNHVDSNPKDGKCDVCGEDMPQQQPDEATVQLELVAEASAEIPSEMTINANAKLKLYDDNTWTLDIKTDAVPNSDFEEAANGTWTLNQDYSMTLTVVEQTVDNSLPASLTVTCDASDYTNLVYASTVAYVSNGLTFNFEFALPAEEVKTPIVTLTATDTQEPAPGYQVTCDAKIELYEDNTWEMFIDAKDGNGYIKAASGTYTNTQTSMTLTATSQTAENSLTGDITVAVDASGYPTMAYSATVNFVNQLTFTFSFTGTLILG